MLHHAVTVALLLICYVVNMVNIGVVIALLHDVADIFLEVSHFPTILTIYYPSLSLCSWLR